MQTSLILKCKEQCKKTLQGTKGSCVEAVLLNNLRYLFCNPKLMSEDSCA